jgi:hypothetical protein
MNKFTLKERLIIIVASGFIITITWLLLCLIFPTLLTVEIIVGALAGMITYNAIDSLIAYLRFKNK